MGDDVGASHRSPRIQPLGDAALLVTFARQISAENTKRVRSLIAALEREVPGGVTDVVPGYATVGVYFDPSRTTRESVERAIRQALVLSATGEPTERPREVEIPVRYDGPDLDDVAARTGLLRAEVVARHAAVTYRVYMLGFVPGFAYLGDLDPALVLPRRATPRQRVPAGSVAIAASQTAVYPLDSPGGWHLIGHTELTLFDARREPPAVLRAGDLVRFRESDR